MKPIFLTTTDEQSLRLNPLYLVAWGPRNVTLPSGGVMRGSFVVLPGAQPRDVLEPSKEIDAMFAEATAMVILPAPTEGVDQPAPAREGPDAG